MIRRTGGAIPPKSGFDAIAPTRAAQALPVAGSSSTPSATRARRIVLRQDESGFAEIEFASNLLHALGRNAGRVRQNRELITAERCRTENIDNVKCVLHEINFCVLLKP